VTSAILHGGTSTVYALGAPPDADAWKVAIPHPNDITEALEEYSIHGAVGFAGGCFKEKHSVRLGKCVAFHTRDGMRLR